MVLRVIQKRTSRTGAPLIRATPNGVDVRATAGDDLDEIVGNDE